MNRKKKWITLGILEAAAALLIAGYCILCQTTEDSRIWGSPSINGVSVGGPYQGGGGNRRSGPF